ncbi:MAG: response regulator [Akkermansiaceae bacterium]|nr:response regulator [Akkermansiaceae bacterium]NNM29556.1 response regulator [Akkermansiaceae bacterium]
MKKLRVLVVDDNRSAAETLSLFFKLEGHDAETAFDGEEAVAAVRTDSGCPFDVIVMDIGMPRLDGCEAAGRIREHLGERAPVLVALTGWNTEEDIARTRAAGFVEHLVKPVDPATLRDLLAKLDVGDAGPSEPAG